MWPVVPGGMFFADVVDDGGDMSGYRTSDRTRFDWHDAGVRTEDEVAFGLTEYFVDRDPQHFAAPFEQLLADRFAAGIDHAKVGAEPSDRIGHLTHQPQHRRHQQRGAHAVACRSWRRPVRDRSEGAGT